MHSIPQVWSTENCWQHSGRCFATFKWSSCKASLKIVCLSSWGEQTQWLFLNNFNCHLQLPLHRWDPSDLFLVFYGWLFVVRLGLSYIFHSMTTCCKPGNTVAVAETTAGLQATKNSTVDPFGSRFCWVQWLQLLIELCLEMSACYKNVVQQQAKINFLLLHLVALLPIFCYCGYITQSVSAFTKDNSKWHLFLCCLFVGLTPLPGSL